jgi:hypothetical protein
MHIEYYYISLVLSATRWTGSVTIADVRIHNFVLFIWFFYIISRLRLRHAPVGCCIYDMNFVLLSDLHNILGDTLFLIDITDIFYLLNTYTYLVILRSGFFLYVTFIIRMTRIIPIIVHDISAN